MAPGDTGPPQIIWTAVSDLPVARCAEAERRQKRGEFQRQTTMPQLHLPPPLKLPTMHIFRA